MPQHVRAIRPMFKTDRWRICRDDIVYILSGQDKGKTGKVLEVFQDPRVPQVIVEGRNLRKKKIRTGPNDEDFYVVTMEAPLHYSQVQVVDPDTGRPIRVVFMYTPEGQRVRARKVPNPTVNDIIPTPPEEPDPRAGLVGPKDTSAELARRGTYRPTQGFPFGLRNLERIWAGLHPDTPAAGAAEPAAAEASGGGGVAASRVLFTRQSAGGGAGGDGAVRGLCTAAAVAAGSGRSPSPSSSSPSSSSLPWSPRWGLAPASAQEEEEQQGGVGRRRAAVAVHLGTAAASFAVSGLMWRRPSRGSAG